MLWNEGNIETFKALESAVLGCRKAVPGLTDHAVARAYEALYQTYDAEARGRGGRPHRLTGTDLAAYDALKAAAEHVLGRGERPDSVPVVRTGVPVALVRDCLRELERSVGRHQRSKGGSSAYLDHVSRFLPPGPEAPKSGPVQGAAGAASPTR